MFYYYSNHLSTGHDPVPVGHVTVSLTMRETLTYCLENAIKRRKTSSSACDATATAAAADDDDEDWSITTTA